MDYAFIGNLEQQKCKQYAIRENIKNIKNVILADITELWLHFVSTIVSIKYEFVEISAV